MISCTIQYSGEDILLYLAFVITIGFIAGLLMKYYQLFGKRKVYK